MKKSRLLGASKTVLVSITVGVAVAMTFATGSANAAVIINVTEAGGDVVFTSTGSLDLTGASFVSTAQYSDGFISGGNNWYIASGAGSTVDLYTLTSADGAFGINTSFTLPDSKSGDDFLIWGNGGGVPRVGVETDYVSGDAIASGMVFNGATIASLGMNFGTYNYAIPNDTITLKIGTVPIPASVWLFGSGLLGLVGMARRKKA